MRLVRRATTVAALLAALVASAQPAGATVGDLGHDVSYPQCGGPLPATGVFGIVGVTGNSTDGGRPFSLNPCLATEGAWAVGTGQPMLYTNTANPGHTSTNWPASGTGRCVNAGVDTDAGCAYEYGRKAAADAFSKAKTALSGVLDPKTVMWWLDVEGSRTPDRPGNSWVGSGVVNAADLQGFVDGLRAAGVPEVGIYSTAYQWNDITGGYTRTNSSSYRTAWKFMPSFPIEDGPVWFAGVSGDATAAATRCGLASFTGGQRLLAQYDDGDFDGDRRCADPDKVLPTASMTAPKSPVTQAYSFGAGWTGADTGSGLATFDVRTTRVASNGTAFSAWSYPASLQRTAVRSATISATGQGWTTCVAVRSRDAAGNVSGWAPSRCTAMPIDDRLLSGSGWSRVSASGWFLSTYSATTRYHATLTRTGLVTSRLTLIAQRCSTCGKVGVYLGSTLLATVDLHASSSYRALIALPRFSLRTTNVTVKVLTSGKPVRIDALTSSRA